MFRLLAGFSLLGLLLSGCSNDPESATTNTVLVETSGRFSGSNLAGNLMATAIRDVYKVDFAFYPSEFLSADRFAIIEEGLTPEQIAERILPLYPETGDLDQFQIGTMRGSDIKRFILNRTAKDYRLDLQVAGLEYDVQFLGGLPTIYQVERARGLPIEDGAYYRVAISDYHYYNGRTFPGYRYGNGLDHDFRPEEGLYSAREALTAFLQNFKTLPLLTEPRAQLRIRNYGGDAISLSIPQIQGPVHLSPYLAKRVTTRGIITALAQLENTTGMEVYIQDQIGDGDEATSDAINLHFDSYVDGLKVGQLVEVEGTVYEVLTFQGMTRTGIREITSTTIVEDDVNLPEPVLIGTGGLMPPNHYISKYIGNVNQKKVMDPDDGIDFWERYEGMRMRIAKPTVVGFGGGKNKYDEEKSYITVYVAPEGASQDKDKSAKSGLISNEADNDFNPEIIRIVDSELAPLVGQAARNAIFTVGDTFSYDLEGVFSFQTNVFGDGEFVLFVTNRFGSTSPRIAPFSERPKTSFDLVEDRLTVASYNVENLAASRTLRVQRIAESISTNLKCPDVLVLPEIQDFNGTDPTGGAAAELTLQGIIDNLACPGTAYRILNVDPVPGQDGGEPGGNIRVAMIYNENRVQFERRGEARALDETVVSRDGQLNLNPGRLYPNDPVFERTRKPLVAQFTFRGQTVYVIGLHLNSKLGDGNAWAAEQPMAYKSRQQRNLLGSRINEFVNNIMIANPNANVIVAGDMNAYHFEDSMKILGGNAMANLMSYKDLVAPNDRYSISFNGNSQAIDHIFASQNLLKADPKFEVLHINSDYMGKISDHDPVIAQFHFP